MEFPNVTIVIPCKNEEESIFAVLTEIQNILKQHEIHSCEIIVVNNNSTDRTVQEVKKVGPEIKIIDCITPGYGAAIMKGINSASHDIICMLDGDGSYNPKDIPELLKLYTSFTSTEKKSGIAMGNRFLNNETKNIKLLHRIFGVPMLNFVTNTLFNAPSHIDSHCGLRVFHKDLIRNLKLEHTDFSFANEMICKALKDRRTITQIPITLRKDLRINTTSKIKVVQDGFYALATILKIRFKR